VVGSNMIQVVGQGFSAHRENLGSFNNQGVEFSARYVVNRHLQFHANYSYLNSDKIILAAPRQQVNLGGNYTYKLVGLNLSAQYIDKFYAALTTAPFTTTMEPNYLLLNARVTARPMKNLELFVAANNLLDQQYEINYGYPMPGINFNAGFNLKF
jgi:outer membrane receptor protein involved in Fe transport